MLAFASQGWTKYRQFRAEHGAQAGVQWLVDRIGGKLLNLSVSEVVWLELADVQLTAAPPAGFDFRWLTAAEAERRCGDEYELCPAHAARIAAGHDLCFAALAGEQLAAYGWYALGSIEAEHCDGVALSFPPDVAYMYKGFTHPDFRGLRLHGLAMKLALERLAAERGVTRLLSTVGWLNFASLKSCDRLGYRRLGRLVKGGFGRCVLSRSPAAARSRGVCFGRRADLSNRRAE